MLRQIVKCQARNLCCCLARSTFWRILNLFCDSRALACFCSAVLGWLRVLERAEASCCLLEFRSSVFVISGPPGADCETPSWAGSRPVATGVFALNRSKTWLLISWGASGIGSHIRCGDAAAGIQPALWLLPVQLQLLVLSTELPVKLGTVMGAARGAWYWADTTLLESSFQPQFSGSLPLPSSAIATGPDASAERCA